MLAQAHRTFLVLGTLFFAPAGCADVERERVAPQATPWGPVRVELTCLAKECVLGQPIRLRLLVTNERKTMMQFRKVNIERGEPLLLYVSTDGTGFERRQDGSGLIPNYGPLTDSLVPGASREYLMCILYSTWSPEKPTFPKPGRYWIRLDYPLLVVGEGPAENSLLPSNAVELRIKEPTGVDAEVFSVLREEALIKFVSGYGGSLGTVRRVLDLVRRHPESSYHADMKAALENYYRDVSTHEMAGVRNDPEWKAAVEDLREWLDIPDPEVFPFSDDKRLGAKFTYRSDDAVAWPDVCEEVSRLTKVPLSVAPDFAERVIYGGWQDCDLRRFMRNLAVGDKEWIRDGDGYKLVPKPKEKAENRER